MRGFAVRRKWPVLIPLFAALAGCAPANVPVSGTVTVNGKPLEDGGVQFVPLEGAAERSSVGGHVTNGAYSIDKTRGLTPGNYRVEIHWNKKTGKKVSNGSGGENDATVEGLSPRYNTASELTAEIKSGPNTGVNFDLKE